MKRSSSGRSRGKKPREKRGREEKAEERKRGTKGKRRGVCSTFASSQVSLDSVRLWSLIGAWGIHARFRSLSSDEKHFIIAAFACFDCSAGNNLHRKKKNRCRERRPACSSWKRERIVTVFLDRIKHGAENEPQQERRPGRAFCIEELSCQRGL